MQMQVGFKRMRVSMPHEHADGGFRHARLHQPRNTSMPKAVGVDVPHATLLRVIAHQVLYRVDRDWASTRWSFEGNKQRRLVGK